MMTNPIIENLRRGYLFCALMLLNSLVGFVLLNVGLFIVFFARDSINSHDIGNRRQNVVFQNNSRFFNLDGSPINNGKRNPYQLDWFDFNAYENIDANYAAEVLDAFFELRKLGFIYQPWVQFSEPPFTSRLVNIDLDPRGFPVRRTLNAPNKQGLPVVQIFTLGGSTTFGYNVSDEHTWPSYLSKILNENARDERLRIDVQVTNYGRGYYNPSQETALITDLLKSGHRPHLVIFLDGVNPTSTQDVPHFTEQISHHVRNIQFVADRPLIQNFQWLPMVRLSNYVRHKLFRPQLDRDIRAKPELTELHRADYVLNSFQQNREIATAICNVYNVSARFFLQPNAHNNYPIELYRRTLPEWFMPNREETRQFYKRLRDKAERIYLGDLFERWGHNRKAIVDDVHYSPSFNQFLARHIANHINLKTLKRGKILLDESGATGASRSFPFVTVNQ
jgi:hypothetical protein